jgi:hypothetical protein
MPRDYDRSLRSTHFVKINWPKGSRMRQAWGDRSRVDIRMIDTGGVWRDGKVEDFTIQTTSYGELNINEMKALNRANEKAVARAAELKRLYKGGNVV